MESLAFLLIILIFLLMVSYVLCDRDMMAPDVLYIAGFVLAVIAASMNVSAWGIDLSAKTIMIILIGALSFVSVGMLYRLSHKKYAFQGCTEIERIQVARWKNVLVIAFGILTMVLYYKEAVRLSAYADSYWKSFGVMVAYKRVISYGDMSLNPVVNQMTKMVYSFGYVYMFMGAFSSCSAAIQGTGSTFIGTTYPSKDADMKGAEEDYLELEKKLDEQIRQMESTHPGYDEYRYQLDEIGHDPYQLISHLTAVYEQFTRGQVKNVIKSLFEQQYLLKVWETIEIRTRMETRVGIRPTIDAFGNVSMETYTYQEEVEYEYKILNVLLKNKGFDTIARKNMDRKQTGRYDAYNLTYGNRPELFGAGSPTYSGGTTGSIGSGGSGGTGGSSGGGFRYDIPEEALSDEKFARVIAEAEKYLGMPYVWGGSSPSTSFDCSGFVCWVINNCGNGWNVGRTTANGLRGKCSYVSPANAQPGDLIFFEKTYNTVGASHVGIYVGNGMMIHCGDPISYTSINSTYWQNHFLGFGRIK